MSEKENIWDKISSKLFGTRAASVYMLIFAVSIAVATFIENDFGTSAAQKVIFQTKWFELIMLLFAISLIYNIKQFRMIPLKKWSLLIFHSAMIIIFIGAGITRYFGYEGVMNIREGSASNSFLSKETYVGFNVNTEEGRFGVDSKVLFASLGNNSFKRTFRTGDDVIKVQLIDFIPNPKEAMTETEDGIPQLKVVFGGANGRQEYYLGQGQTKLINNLLFNFKDEEVVGAFNVRYINDSLQFKSEETFTQMVMATQKLDTILPSTDYYPLRLRSMYSDGPNGFVFGDFSPSGVVNVVSDHIKIDGNSTVALKMAIDVNGEKDTTFVYGRDGVRGKPAYVELDKKTLDLSYGSKVVPLPFELKLFDFELERYPGTDSPASFSSKVQLNDKRTGIEEPHHIYMNNILDHDGYRFFQAAYDPDEKGTILSVNHDFWGTWVSYAGYFLMTLGMIMVFFSKNTRFYELSQKLKKINRRGTLVWLFLALSTLSFGQDKIPNNDGFVPPAISLEHTELFNKLIVQDFNGRMKPVHTMTREVIRKIHGSNSYKGLDADQVFLGMFANSELWYGIPFIKLGQHPNVKKLLGVAPDAKYAAYINFFTPKGDYLLADEVRRISALEPIDKGTFEKEIIKIDEKLNITNMIFSGQLLRIIPVPKDPNNQWLATQWNIQPGEPVDSLSTFFFDTYINGLRGAVQNDDYKLINELTTTIGDFQKREGKDIIPSDTQLNAEITLNNLNVFNWLALYYSILGLLFLFFLIFSIFKANWSFKKVYYTLVGLLVLGFLFHTLGLGLRWYVSGRAPWSNGYESMIYIAWTTTLAGLIFVRKSFGAFAATCILASTVLGVALLSFLSPQITPLVPVLKSYWLTIHVSLEAGSYGFLGLGAVIGIINLMMMSIATNKNIKEVTRVVKEMTYISEMCLIGGLFMISVGTYLGGIWANESWGRYWGWDAKETWALVSILVYAFILHMRFIPKLSGLFAFNFATLFGLATVIMTYYGVNYYLSGLHSYATGDPVPIPSWVYGMVVFLMLLSMIAYWRKSQFKSLT